jgi:hypothetical protein
MTDVKVELEFELKWSTAGQGTPVPRPDGGAQV